VWEGDALRRVAGVKALRLFTLSEREAAEFAAAAEALGITSVELAEISSDTVVVVIMVQLMRALVEIFRLSRATRIGRGGRSGSWSLYVYDCGCAALSRPCPTVRQSPIKRDCCVLADLIGAQYVAI